MTEPRKDEAATEREAALWTGDEGYRHLVDCVTDYAIFLLDAQGRIATWNPGARRIKGYEAHEIIGQSFTRFYPPEAIAANWPAQELYAARESGRFEDEGWRIRKDGSRFWANVVITALRDDEGRLRGYAKITRDWTERRTALEALRRSEEHYRLLVEGVQDHAMYVLDTDGRVVTWNLGALRIKGFTAAEVVGTFFGRFFTPEDAAAREPEAALETARQQGSYESEGWRVRRDGSRFWAHARLTALRDAFGNLVGFAKITRDLTQRRQVEALEDARQRMNEFVAMLAHELRNPLAPIRNAAEIVRRANLPPDAAWAHGVIGRQVEHLTRLVDDLLDVSRITMGKIVLHREPVLVSQVVARAVEASQPLVGRRRHALHLAADPNPVYVDGDATRLAQVVTNLLNNAAKYTPPGGRIRLSTALEDGRAVVRVSDDGIGMTPELIARIFELFAQGEQTLDRSEGGLGIGLTLAKRLVEMHGGTIEAASEGPGKGSSFCVRLPAMTAESATEGAAPFEAPAPAGRSVLIVDDNRDSADSMAMLLRHKGHAVRTAYDGESALALAAECAPDVVLLDIGLPRMDGYEVAQRLRALPGGGRMTLVAMTGYGQADDRRRTQEAGFAEHLVKPVEGETIDAVLNES